VNLGAFPPGVTGLEPEITGLWSCIECETILPEECPDNVCPDGCCEPEYDAEEQYEDIRER
jgi:hypothetical protein